MSQNEDIFGTANLESRLQIFTNLVKFQLFAMQGAFDVMKQRHCGIGFDGEGDFGGGDSPFACQVHLNSSAHKLVGSGLDPTKQL